MEELREYSQKVLFISIASGKSLIDLETALEDPQASIVRVMPNVNVSVGAGVSAICKNEGCHGGTASASYDDFEAIGSVYPCRIRFQYIHWPCWQLTRIRLHADRCDGTDWCTEWFVQTDSH